MHTRRQLLAMASAAALVPRQLAAQVVSQVVV